MILKKVVSEFRNIYKAWGFVMAVKLVVFGKVFKCQRVKHKAILGYLKTRYAGLIEEYRHRTQPGGRLSCDCPIWICWFQGKSGMPSLVKGCFDSVKRHAAKHPVVLITMENYQKYVSIPTNIIRKLHCGEISLTHFSDIIRNNLLADHGGIWLDATILLTGELKDLNLPFLTIKLDVPENHYFVSKSRWTGFCMGGVKGNLLNSFVRDMFNIYHQKESYLIDYLLIDYIIATGYNEIPEIKRLIDKVPYSNPGLYYIQQNWTKPVNEHDFADVCKTTSIFKLSYKIPVPENKNTLYYYLGFKKCLPT